MRKLIIRSAVYFAVLFILSMLLKNFEISTPVILIGGAVVLALFNTVLRPILNVFALPINILTLGIGVIFVNMLTLLITDGIFNNITINGFWVYLLLAISIMATDSFIRHKRIEEKLF